MLLKTRLIVLGTIKQGEGNLVVRCFTEALGYESFLVKGAFSKRKSGVHRAYFQPLALLEAEINHRPNANLQYFKELAFLDPHPPGNTEVKKQTGLLFLAEVLDQVLREEGASNSELFEFLFTTISWLLLHEAVGNFHLKFLIALTRFMGFYPNTTSIKPNTAYFELETACFHAQKPVGFAIHGNTLEHFRNLLGTNFDNIHTLHIQITQKHQLLEAILKYYQVHLQRFETPKSIPILQQLFA